MKKRAHYPNYYNKRTREIRSKLISATKGKCKLCSRKGSHFHHIDRDTSNNTTKNLMLVCTNCHGLLHAGQRASTSKYKRLYGLTLQEMSDKFGGCKYTYHRWHIEGKLVKELAALKRRG